LDSLLKSSLFLYQNIFANCRFFLLFQLPL
jgi:hypothetical protein